MDLAPIVLFVYNRPWHTRQTLEALSKNELASESELYVFADGAKDTSSIENINRIEEVRSIISEKKWCRKVNLIISERNKGIENSTIDGVTQVINKHGKVIVLEDDLVTSPFFLLYMNECLEKYKEIKNIYSINGYMFPIQSVVYETVLLPFTSSWGWATWQDRWAIFERDPKESEVIQKNSFLSQRFNLADFNYASMFSLNTWDIRWYYSVFIRNGLCVFPTISLIYNIGFDGSGVHYTRKNDVVQNLSMEKISTEVKHQINLDFYNKYVLYFTKKRRNLFEKFLFKIKKFLKINF